MHAARRVEALSYTGVEDDTWERERLGLQQINGRATKWHNVASPLATKWACIQVGLECICRLGWKFIAFAL